MFLDAALLLRGQPLQDLRCAWTAMVQFDDSLIGDPDGAARIVSNCIAELVTSSLVTIHVSGRQQDLPNSLVGVPLLGHRCVAMLSLLVILPC